MVRCCYCYHAAVEHPRRDLLPICNSCAATNRCYFCRENPVTRTLPTPRNWQSVIWTTAPSEERRDPAIPNCDGCWNKQLKIARVETILRAVWLGVLAAATIAACVAFGLTLELLILAAIAYAWCGVAVVVEDFKGDPYNRPIWTHKATIGKVLFFVLVWPLRRAWMRGGFRSETGWQATQQDFVDSLVAAGFQLLGATAAFAVIYWLTGVVLSALPLRLLVTVAVVLVLGAFGIPAISLLVSVVDLVVTMGIMLGMLVLGNWARPFTLKKDPPADVHVAER